VVCVEWLDPLYLAGHWVPELVEAAGGQDVGATAGSHSARREWAELRELSPDLFVIMLCGFGVERTIRELAAAPEEARAALQRKTTWVLDGNAYTSRSGPRVVDGAERLCEAFLGRETRGMVRWGRHGR
jgi:iron complex transport system substrate-binding protein